MRKFTKRFHKEISPHVWDTKKMMKKNRMEIYRVNFKCAKCTSVAKIKRFIKNTRRP